MRIALYLLLLAPRQADGIKISLESPERRFNPDKAMSLRFTIENLADAPADLPEPADWIDGLEIRDAKNNIVKATGTSRETKRNTPVDGRGFIGRTVDVAKALAGKDFVEGMFTFRWSWMGRTTAEVRVAVMRDYTVTMETNFGDLTIELFPDSAPYHVLHFLELVRTGKYDKSKFHRVIAGFVAQGGRIGDATKLKAEFNDRKHKVGTVAMARADKDIDSAGSEFYITLADVPELDGRYTVFGNVKEGIETVQEIGKVKTDHSPCAGCGKRLGAETAPGHCGSHHEDKPDVDVIIKKATVRGPKK